MDLHVKRQKFKLFGRKLKIIHLRPQEREISLKCTKTQTRNREIYILIH